MKQITIHISGHVQGVFYRASAKIKADELGVQGFVQNLNDGRVYIEAVGEAESLQEFVDWCRVGPPGARVDHVDVREGNLKSFSGFIVSRSF